ncbi:MOSC domain-containing protein [Croceitalea sp. MTPC9]|uniref:MOSC domain-containing protein n=1 Tax=unclassified Croceitalea TaxID=2632280 RepID=UPI002B3A87BD|nr:MOSC domain-containing protein [Croceitalea sp. MTPC6]GMN17901.1 MOSC domain-containing protein [Croceitalea sp. MTPC9]
MKVISTNLAQPRTVLWRGREIQTGIYKEPVEESLLLQKEDVANDTVIDRKHHGGEFKACYLFSSDYYSDWKGFYPNLNWDWGMFGENLTVEGLDENKLCIGDLFKIGTALVQITEPRQPCHKLGIKFGDHKVIKEFIEYGHPGTYVRIITEGRVKKGDILELKQKSKSTLTVQQYNQLVNQKEKDLELVKLAVVNNSIREEKREKLKKLL